MSASRSLTKFRPRALFTPQTSYLGRCSQRRWESSSHVDQSKLNEELIAKNMQKQPLKGEWMRTGKVPYPKHVWSPTGGWYSEPSNWKTNTAITWFFMFCVTAVVFNISANLEDRNRMPEPGRFFPSRYWSKQIIEYEKEQKEKKKRESL